MKDLTPNAERLKSHNLAINYSGHDPLLDSKQAAVILGLENYHTLEVWRSVKRYPELEYVRIGRKVKYRLSVLERFIERNTVSV
jgi:hypothetical protein